jgi:hypothetical protein
VAIGTNRYSPDGTVKPYTVKPIISPAYSPTEKQRLALLKGLLEHPNTHSGVLDRMLSIERIETILDVYDHDNTDPNNPYPLATHNEFSSNIKHSTGANQIRMLLKYKVPQKTNMSLLELMNLPTETFKIVVNSCRALTTTEMNEMDDLEGLMSALGNRM